MQIIKRKLVQRACFLSALGIIVSILVWPMLARAAAPAQLCEAAARTAAQRHGVPLDVMRAVALVETGRSRNGVMQPWPWAIHALGEGRWFDGRDAALRHARAVIAQGRRNVDLGCFQVNYRWHGHKFASLEQMIDPAQNAEYAAQLLAQHKQRLGSWERAVGAYHSATPEFARRYLSRFREMRAQLAPAPTAPATPQAPPTARDNQFALLASPGEPRLGSLFSQSSENQTRLIALEPAQP